MLSEIDALNFVIFGGGGDFVFFFVVLVEMRSSTYSVDILMYDIFWLSWFLENQFYLYSNPEAKFDCI